jgi:uncharacterized repeat protein (TIGR01451 family)
MSLFNYFRREKKGKNNKRKQPFTRASLHVQLLEDRTTPAVISGFVYQDLNNNGIKESGELPIANTPIQLKNAQGVVIGNTTTDANGFYQFTHDSSVDTQPKTLTKEVVFPSQATSYTASGLLDQFDPSLGQLLEVKVTHEGSITSDIKAENTSPNGAATINATVSGKLNLTAPGINDQINVSDNAGSFNAGTFDNTLDFTGNSGISFGTKTANGSKTLTLTGSDMNAYIGTGKVTVNESITASSKADGGGNLTAQISSTGQAKVTVTYKYIPNNGLQPGNYVVIEVTQPAGLLDGKDAANNVPIANSVGTDIINVTLLANGDSTNNNFGELPPPQISGYVYHDVNNNGIKDAGEEPIPGASVTLSGTDDLGAVNKSATTDANGFYQFLNLRPGNYTLNETQPNGYLDGKDTAGSLGGTVTNDQIAGIVLPAGGQSLNNNFGELKNASLSGFVYADANNNGIKEAGETPLAGIVITLTGFTSSGPVSQTATTDASGFYQFNNLLPGTYSILEGATVGYLDGKDTIGSQGGTTTNDTFSTITVVSGTNGVNNNFGELLPAKLSGFVYHDVNQNGAKDVGDNPISGVVITLTGADDLGAVSKTAVTDAAGHYKFENLRPGMYTLTQTQPTGYTDGQDSVGTQGGGLANDQINNIVLAAGVDGQNNNFGEIRVETADVGIVKTSNPGVVYVNNTYSYTLTITNYGAFTATNVKVTDPIPAGVTYISATGNGWTITQSSGIITATMPSLAVNASSTIIVTVKAPGVPTTVLNEATVESETPDNNPLNNKSNVPTEVITEPNVQDTVRTMALGNVIFVNKGQLFVNPDPEIVQFNLNLALADTLLKSLGGVSGDNAKILTAAQQIGTSGAQSLIAQLWNSDYNRTEQVKQAYQQILGRAPTAAEIQTGMQTLRSGKSETDLAVQLIASAEYQQSHATAGLMAAGINLNLTGKLPDAATLALQVQALGNQTVTQLAQSVAESTDALKKIIDRNVRWVLNRAATDADFALYMPLLQAKSLTSDTLAQTLMTTQEFLNRLPK